MEAESFVHGLEIIVALLCFITLLPSTLNSKNLTHLYLLGSVLSYINVKIFMYIGPSYLLREVEAWGNFISISLILSALFVIIRDSKPVFARFPMYLTLLPLSGILFFAIIPTSYAIKGILELIMQAGALVVTLLLFGVNTHLYGWKWTYIASLIAFISAYIFPLLPLSDPFIAVFFCSISLCVGMIFLTFSLIKYPFNTEFTQK